MFCTRAVVMPILMKRRLIAAAATTSLLLPRFDESVGRQSHFKDTVAAAAGCQSPPFALTKKALDRIGRYTTLPLLDRMELLLSNMLSRVSYRHK